MTTFLPYWSLEQLATLSAINDMPLETTAQTFAKMFQSSFRGIIDKDPFPKCRNAFQTPRVIFSVTKHFRRVYCSMKLLQRKFIKDITHEIYLNVT